MLFAAVLVAAVAGSAKADHGGGHGGRGWHGGAGWHGGGHAGWYGPGWHGGGRAWRGRAYGWGRVYGWPRWGRGWPGGGVGWWRGGPAWGWDGYGSWWGGYPVPVSYGPVAAYPVPPEPPQLVYGPPAPVAPAPRVRYRATKRRSAPVSAPPSTGALIGAAAPPPIVVLPPPVTIVEAAPPPAIFVPPDFALVIGPPILDLAGFGPFWGESDYVAAGFATFYDGDPFARFGGRSLGVGSAFHGRSPRAFARTSGWERGWGGGWRGRGFDSGHRGWAGSGGGWGGGWRGRGFASGAGGLREAGHDQGFGGGRHGGGHGRD